MNMTGTWVKGKIGEYSYCLKYYQQSSTYGINEGRISKMEIRKDGMILANYDRDWDVEPAEEALDAYNELLKRYN